MSVAEHEPSVFRWHVPEHLPCGGCFGRRSVTTPDMLSSTLMQFDYYMAGCACGLHVIECMATCADEAIAYLRDAGWLIEDGRVICVRCRSRTEGMEPQ